MLVGKMECYTRTEPARPALARVDTASFKFSTNTGYTSSGSSLASRMIAESRPVPRSAGSPVTTFS